VIDPSRHVKNYLEFTGARGSEIRMVIDTHAHADHISWGATLSQAAQARYFLHPFDAIHPMDALRARFQFEPLWDGKELELGGVTIRTIHTPGHTLDEISLLLNEKYLLTGDTLFIRSAGRPDLGGKGDP
jgi:glyoxylase-like metal-dependent hydrolase (beta-lactamase superfamily II)